MPKEQTVTIRVKKGSREKLNKMAVEKETNVGKIIEELLEVKLK